ncbi:MAG: cobyrinate a,c-diamide synthase [Clostridia bacterium]
MTEKQISRVLIAGTNSGCGKTTVTCAILSALVARKMNVSSFKCGPDYIDPMFHGKIIGVPSSNLDAFFFDNNTLKYLLAQNSKDISVIEGVMGFYDGMSINSTKSSSYDIAKITNTPVILTVNCRGLAYSILPMIEGFAKHKKDYNFAGVILNNITKSTYQSVKPLIENAGIKVLGYLPKLPENLVIESRHLGLVTANEIQNIKEKLVELGEFAEQTIDIDKIIECANSAKNISYSPISYAKTDDNLTIAVAYDNAFCFYYKDNLKLFEKLGVKIAYFSPINDKKLPDCDGLYLGGGYPELYLQKLSDNQTMLKSIYEFLQKGMPCIAECGGFMYLNNEIDGHKMVGFLDGLCENTKKLSRFGYATFNANCDNLLCKIRENFKGHEFHYYDCTQNGSDFLATKENGKQWNAAIANENLYAGFPHINFYSNIKIAENFIKKCQEKKDGKY